jgi:hypothetical protein
MTKNLVVWTLFGLALVVNPNLACSSSEDEEEFSYSEQDMKMAALGQWQGEADIAGEAISFTLTLSQASSKSTTQSISAPPIRPQCAQRSFVKPAGACASLSTMPLTGSITSDSPLLAGVVEGEVMAGRTLDSSYLRLQREDGTVLQGSLKQQAVEGGEIVGAQSGSFALSRSE